MRQCNKSGCIRTDRTIQRVGNNDLCCFQVRQQFVFIPAEKAAGMFFTLGSGKNQR